MDYSADTPFKDYQDIQNAVRTGEAILSYNRVAAFNIACDAKPICAISNLIVPVVSVTLMWIICAWLGITKWVLLFGVIVLLINTIISNRLNGFLWVVAIVAIVLPLVFDAPYWLLAIGVGIIGMMLGDYIWWGLISGCASIALMSDESLFEVAWTTWKVALRTKEGFHIYGKESIKDILG